MTIHDLIEKYGLTQTGISRNFKIPLRTVQHWCSTNPNDRRPCPPYIVDMMDRIIELQKTVDDLLSPEE